MMGGGDAAFHQMTFEQSQHLLTSEQSQFFWPENQVRLLSNIKLHWNRVSFYLCPNDLG